MTHHLIEYDRNVKQAGYSLCKNPLVVHNCNFLVLEKFPKVVQGLQENRFHTPQSPLTPVTSISCTTPSCDMRWKHPSCMLHQETL